MIKPSGIIPAVITPMKAGNLDYEATTRHLEILINEGVDGLFILGTNGEFHVLSDDEKVDFAKHVIEVVAKRVPVYVGVGACGTKLSVDLAKRMADLKPDALSVITPYLVKISQDDLINHYQEIADATDIPVILYNIPANTGINIEPSTLESLINHPNIVGIKDSSGNMELMEKYIKIRGNSEFSVLVGSDSKILDAYKLGADGCVASTANVITPQIRKIIDAFLNEKIEIAQKEQDKLDSIRGIMKIKAIPSVLKRLVSLKNGDVGEARLPAPQIGNKYDLEIEEVLALYR